MQSKTNAQFRSKQAHADDEGMTTYPSQITSKQGAIT
jgi:hypothetical protein